MLPGAWWNCLQSGCRDATVLGVKCPCGVRWLPIAGLALAASTRAHAAPGLGWHAPTGCPADADVRARIEHRLGGPIERAVHDISVEITVARAGFVAHIDLGALTGGDDVRVLSSPSCSELTDAIAVVIARVARDAVRPSVPVVHASAAIAPAPAERTMAPIELAAAPADEPAHTWGGGVRMLGLSGIGATPRVGFGGEAGAYVRREDVFAELAIAQWLTSTRLLEPLAVGRVGASLRETSLRVGWGPEHTPLRVWTGGELGMLDAKGEDLGNNQLGSSTWVSAVAGLGVAWPMFPRARLVGMFEVAVPFARHTVSLMDGGEAFRPDVVAARYGVGLELGWQ